jgi:hypothetical protein
MNKTKNWGYKKLSAKSFNFYYQDREINIKDIAREIDAFREIQVLSNGSITVYTEEDWLDNSISNILSYAKRIDKN